MTYHIVSIRHTWVKMHTIDDVVHALLLMASLADFKPVKRLVLVGGPDDRVVTPWESRLGVTSFCVTTSVLTDALPYIRVTCMHTRTLNYSFFGFYPENDVSTVIPMEQQQVCICYRYIVCISEDKFKIR